LSALALARAGARVLMHGSNEHSAGISVELGLAALGLRVSADREEAARVLRDDGFAYLPLAALSPEVDDLLRMRRLFGLRSPVNTVARLLNPGDAAASVDGVFHPPYIAVHLGVAERLARRRLLVLKGGGGEAEWVPRKSTTGWLWDNAHGRSEIDLPARNDLDALTPATDSVESLARVWRGDEASATPVATVIATIGLGLIAMGWAISAEVALGDAARIWNDRLPV
jgi:anthranilate phosphoribosyltransferase